MPGRWSLPTCACAGCATELCDERRPLQDHVCYASTSRRARVRFDYARVPLLPEPDRYSLNLEI